MSVIAGKVLLAIILIIHLSSHQSADGTFLKPTRATDYHHHKHHKQKHHSKRGLFSVVPTYSAGYDFPIVRHSYLKPLYLDYPVDVPLGVKIPFGPPIEEFRYPVPVGHRVPVPHPHYGLRFPHHHLNIVPAVPLHHEIVRPIPKPVHIVPVAPPPVIHISRPQPQPIVPVHFNPEPIVPVPTVLRPGNQWVSSFFATYPKHQFPSNFGHPFLLQRPEIPQHYYPVPNGAPATFPVLESGQGGIDHTSIDTQQTNTNTNTDQAWRPVANPTDVYPTQDSETDYQQQHPSQIPVYETPSGQGYHYYQPEAKHQHNIPQPIPQNPPNDINLSNHIPHALQPPITRPSEDFHGYQ